MDCERWMGREELLGFCSEQKSGNLLLEMAKSAAIEVKSYSQIRDLVEDGDPDMAQLLTRLELKSKGQPNPSRFELKGPMRWQIYWDLAPQLTIQILRARSDTGEDWFRLAINGQIDRVYSPRELEDELLGERLADSLRSYQHAQWIQDQLGPLSSFVQWSKCWRCAYIGQKLSIYPRDNDKVLLSYRIGTRFPIYLQNEESNLLVASVLKDYIQEFLIDKK